MTGTLVLVRHGESRWNECNRFTGWVDVPLSEKGIREAELCAIHCEAYNFTSAFTSKLERAHATSFIILSRQNRTGIVQHEHDTKYSRWINHSNTCGGLDLPIFESTALNERYYGSLQGMEKGKAEKKFGDEQVFAWRRSYNARPPGGAESLHDTFHRTQPFFKRHILTRVRRGEQVLVVAHGNTLRAIIKHLENISDRDIAFVDLPEAKPIVYKLKRGAFKRVAGHYEFTRPLR